MGRVKDNLLVSHIVLIIDIMLYICYYLVNIYNKNRQQNNIMAVIEDIENYINGFENRTPIFVSDIKSYLFSIHPSIKADVINEYLIRYQNKNNNFIRFQKGIYFKTTNTPFGMVGINYMQLFRRIYITDDKTVYGFETGPSFMNKIGVTTQMPKCTYISTMHNRLTVNGEKDNLVLIKPVAKISKENYRYFQFLDLLLNKYNVKFDVINYLDVLRNYRSSNNLSFEKLLYYAKYYKNKGLYAKIAELAVGEI